MVICARLKKCLAAQSDYVWDDVYRIDLQALGFPIFSTKFPDSPYIKPRWHEKANWEKFHLADILDAGTFEIRPNGRNNEDAMI